MNAEKHENDLKKHPRQTNIPETMKALFDREGMSDSDTSGEGSESTSPEMETETNSAERDAESVGTSGMPDPGLLFTREEGEPGSGTSGTGHAALPGGDFKPQTRTMPRPVPPPVSPDRSTFGLIVLSRLDHILARVKSVVNLVTFFLLGLLILYLSIQFHHFFHTIAELPLPLFILCVTISLSFLALAIFYFGKLVYSFIRKKTSPRISYSDLEKIDHRFTLQRTKAYEQLREYVLDFPLEEWKTRFAEHENEPSWSDFKNIVDKLRIDVGRPSAHLCHEKWLEGFRDDFQARLDACATKKIAEAAGWTAAKTAVSPWPLVDMLIVLFWSFKLMEDLCACYHLRVGKMGTLSLLAQVSGTIFLSGKIDTWEEPMQHTFEYVTQGILTNDMVRKILGMTAAKAAAGLANYYLMRRLGFAMMDQLKPMVR